LKKLKNFPAQIEVILLTASYKINTEKMIGVLPLQVGVIHLLQKELGNEQVELNNGQVVIRISTVEFERHLGNILQQIYKVVETRYPERKEHLSLLIRDTDDRYENSFKIWKSV